MTRTPADPAARVRPIVDANVHLWDTNANPVFWLSDRSMLVDMLGNYDTLPDRYTIKDYRAATSALEVSGIVWSDPGTADPLAAIDHVRNQDEDGIVVGIVTLADPFDAGFADFVARVRHVPLVSSVRVRLGGNFGDQEQHGIDLTERMLTLAEAGLVATIETSADLLEHVAELASALPDLRIVVDHFGWPEDLSETGRASHLRRLRRLAGLPNVATRIDAIGTIFGQWDVPMIAPWLQSVVDLFGADRCMFGSDMPIETLRSSFDRLYGAFDEIFASRSDRERTELFQTSATRWLGARADHPSPHAASTSSN